MKEKTTGDWVKRNEKIHQGKTQEANLDATAGEV